MTDSSQPFFGKTVVLAATKKDFSRAGDILSGAIEAFDSLGCRTVLVPDGDRRAFEGDLLVLYGNCRAFRAYPNILRRHAGPRPLVTMWQVDPLPPCELDQRLENLALRYINLFAHRRLLRPIEMLLGFSLYGAIMKRGLGPFSTDRIGHAIDPSMVRTTVETYAAIRRGLTGGWLDRAYMSTTEKQRFLAERGIESGFAPNGYYRNLGVNQHHERDIDVLFIGTLKQKSRQDRLNQVVTEIRRAGANVEVAEKGLYGDRREKILNRTKIVLHIHKYPWDTPWMRWVMAAGNGALVVSEPLVDPKPFKPGVHYFEAPLRQLPDLISELLAEPDRLQSAATCCEAFVRREFTVRGSLKAMLYDFFPPDRERSAS